MVLLSRFAESLWVEGTFHGGGDGGVDDDGREEGLPVLKVLLKVFYLAFDILEFCEILILIKVPLRFDFLNFLLFFLQCFNFKQLTLKIFNFRHILILLFLHSFTCFFLLNLFL